MDNDLILNILQIVVVVLATLIGRYLIPWLKLKVDVAKLQKITEDASKYVQAAEQMIKGQGLGAEKREKVTEWLTTSSEKLGLDLSEEEIRILIESFVFTMKQEQNKTQ